MARKPGGKKNPVNEAETPVSPRATQDPYRQLFATTDDALFVVERRSRSICQANAAAQKLSGFSHKKLLSLKLDALFAPESRKVVASACRARLGREQDCVLQTARGKKLPVSLRVSLVSWGGKNCLLAVVRESSERVREAEGLKRSERRARLLSRAALSLVRLRSPERRYMALLRFAVEETASLCGVLGFADPGRLCFVPAAILSEEAPEGVLRELCEEVWPQVARSREPVRGEVGQGKRAGHVCPLSKRRFLAVPCVGRGAVVGMVCVCGRKEGYSAWEASLLSELGRLAAVAIFDQRSELARQAAEEAVQKTRRLQSKLLEAARLLPECRTPEEVWQKTGRLFAEGAGALAAVLYVPEDAGQEVALVGSVGVRVEGEKKALPKRVSQKVRGPVGCACESKKPIFFGASEEPVPREKRIEAPLLKGALGGLSVPLLAERSCIGVVLFYFDRPVRSPSDLQAAQLAASCLAPWLARLRSEEQVLESEERFRSLVENSLVGVYLIQEEVFKYVNPRMAEIFHYRVDELIEKRGPRDLVAPEDWPLVRENLKRRERGEIEALNYTFRGMRKGGERFDVEVFGARALYRGRPAVVGTLVDITERKRLEEELARAQRLEVAGRVAGQIAHDFNNLLSPLTAYPDLIRLQLPPGHPVVEMVDQMQQVARQMAEINQELLTLGRRGHYPREVLHLDTLVEKILKSFRFPPGVGVRREIPHDLHPIRGGEAQLLRVFTNLLTNAVEAMNGVGELEITAANVYVDRPLRGYQTVQRGEYVKVTVRDTGCGIRPEDLPHVFDAFFTTKTADRHRGSGLGLSVVRAVMEDHNGYVTVRSKLGKGSSFCLYFPIVRDVVVVSSPPEELPRGHERILVVDDDPIQREVLSRLLRALGYRVSIAQSGEEAVEVLSRAQHDLLILDMVMDGIDGAETFRAARAVNPTQRAILLSGYAESDRVAEALSAGAGQFLRKPVDLRKLAEGVRRELDQKGDSGGAEKDAP